MRYCGMAQSKMTNEERIRIEQRIAALMLDRERLNQSGIDATHISVAINELYWVTELPDRIAESHQDLTNDQDP